MKTNLIHVGGEHDLAPRVRRRVVARLMPIRLPRPSLSKSSTRSAHSSRSKLGDRRFVSAGRMGFDEPLEMVFGVVHGRRSRCMAR